MSILNDAVFSSTSRLGRGMFQFDQISDEQKRLIKSITKHQRRHFKNKKLIPQQVLEVFWSMGILPVTDPPRQGMRISEFCDILKKGEYRNEAYRALAIRLRDMIEEEEFPEANYCDERYVKFGRKFIPVSFLRQEPGTIFR